jgi:IS5 family transposase
MSFYVPNLEELVPADHKYRRILNIVDFDKLTEGLRVTYSSQGRAGYPVTTAFKCLLLQFMNDLSDRELEDYFKDSLAGKLFCGFELLDKTPDHTYFCKIRSRFGIHKLTELFNKFQKALKDKKLIREVFTFADASELRSRIDHWKARDIAIADKENDETDDDGNPTMNNKNVSKYLTDPEARFGAKGKNKIWIGYKRHLSVDMSSGLINKVDVTPANVSDGIGLKNICPNGGMVFADKAYCVKAAQEIISENGCHSGAIKKNNMKDKNKGLDGWISKARMPFEGVFARMSKDCRYKGKDKVLFQAIMQALTFNLKRLLTIEAEPIPIV